jgi:hypothetical protein
MVHALLPVLQILGSTWNTPHNMEGVVLNHPAQQTVRYLQLSSRLGRYLT